MILTYKDVVRDSILLAEKINPKFYKAIHPIPAGGIAIGVTMSAALGLDNILSVEEYENYKNKEEVLVVDDLVDSGQTLLKYPNSDCAVLYKKIHCNVVPKYYLKEIASEWVTFPHEKDKDGILDHLIRVFSFINIQLSEKEETLMLQILRRIKNK